MKSQRELENTPLYCWIKESNSIEGLYHDITIGEMDALQTFLDSPVTVKSLVEYVSKIQHDAVLRDKPGLNVRIGVHFPMPGGPAITDELQNILLIENPYKQHLLYEHLHPFTDGNGRSGRALFLANTSRYSRPRLSFLHDFYYRTLDSNSRRLTKKEYDN